MSNIPKKLDELNKELTRREENIAKATAERATEQGQQMENCQRLFDEIVIPILQAAKKVIEEKGHEAFLTVTQGQGKTMPSARFVFKPKTLLTAQENFLKFSCDGNKINSEVDVKISGHSYYGVDEKSGLETQEEIESVLDEYIDLIIEKS